jgi:hypothetical protein
VRTTGLRLTGLLGGMRDFLPPQAGAGNPGHQLQTGWKLGFYHICLGTVLLPLTGASHHRRLGDTVVTGTKCVDEVVTKCKDNGSVDKGT